MKKKLILEEVEEVINQEEDDKFQSSSLVSSLIRSEWDTVELVNAVLATFQDRGTEEDVQLILEEIITDHYKNIGQLEKCLQLVNTSALNIEDGKEDVEAIIES